MKIDTTKIEGYAEMSAEEKIAALEAFEYEDNAQALADNEAKLQKYKDAVSKANSEAAENKKKYRELLSEDERKTQETAEKYSAIEKELETLRTEKKISEFKAQYLALGYDEDLATKTAQAMADGDMETVFANSKAFLDNHDKAVEANLLKDTPHPRGGGTKPQPKTPTLEEFNAMTYEEVAKLKAEQPEVYDSLMS